MGTSSKYLVYGLVDPHTLGVRYIGKSTSGLNRPKQHRAKSSLRDRTHRAHWILSLKNQGLDYVIAVLEETTLERLEESERWWIAYGRLSNWELTNLTEGGDGTVGYKHTEQTRLILSEKGNGQDCPAVDD